MNSFIKIVTCSMLVLSIGKVILASDNGYKKIGPREKRALLTIVKEVLPTKGVRKIITGYLGKEYDEKQLIDLHGLVSSKFASAGISKNCVGNLEKLPPEMLMHVIKFIGTKLVPVQKIGLPGVATDIALCGNDCIAVTYDGNLSIFSLKKLALVKTVATEEPAEASLAPIMALPNDRLAFSGAHGSVKIVDIDLGKIIKTLSGHTRGITSLAQVSDDIIASGSWDHTIKVWSINDGTCIMTLQDPGQVHPSLVGLPHGKLASRSFISRVNHVKIWDIGSGECIQVTPVPYTTNCRLIALSPTTLAAEFDNHTINILDIESGQWVQEIRTKQMMAAASLAKLSGNRLAASHGDGTINTWHIGSGNHLQTLQNTLGIHLILALPGNRLVAGSWDAFINLYKGIMDCDHIARASHGGGSSSSSASSSSSIATSDAQRCLVQ